MTGHRMHWSAPHTAEDILATARRPDLPEPTEIHVRPAVLERLRREALATGDVPVAGEDPPVGDRLDGIPVVVDDDLPDFPGYEIHRVCMPGDRRRAA